MTKECRICHKKFESMQYRGQAETCSKECSRELKRRTDKTYHQTHKSNPPPLRVFISRETWSRIECQICQHPFWVSPCYRTKIKTCGNKECSSNWAKQKLKGTKSPLWKGARSINTQGYRIIRLSALQGLDYELGLYMADKNKKFILEHRLVMARKLNRPLLDSEIVHHINGNRLDNRSENLKVLSQNHAPGHEIICPHCGYVFSG